MIRVLRLVIAAFMIFTSILSIVNATTIHDGNNWKVLLFITQWGLFFTTVTFVISIFMNPANLETIS